MFDMLAISVAVFNELRAVLQNRDIVKVMHDCRQDSAALFYQQGVVLHNIFDTQVDFNCPTVDMRI